MALAIAAIAVAVMFAPEYRGIWIAVGGLGAFGISGMVWRDVESGEHPTNATLTVASDRRSSPPSSGSPQ